MNHRITILCKSVNTENNNSVFVQVRAGIDTGRTEPYELLSDARMVRRSAPDIIPLTSQSLAILVVCGAWLSSPAGPTPLHSWRRGESGDCHGQFCGCPSDGGAASYPISPALLRRYRNGGRFPIAAAARVQVDRVAYAEHMLIKKPRKVVRYKPLVCSDERSGPADYLSTIRCVRRGQ